MCFDPWEHSAQRMGLQWMDHVIEVERGRNVATNAWKASGFIEAIRDKYRDEDEFDVADLEAEIERLREKVESDPRWLPLLEAAEQALKERAEQGAMA